MSDETITHAVVPISSSIINFIKNIECMYIRYSIMKGFSPEVRELLACEDISWNKFY